MRKELPAAEFTPLRSFFWPIHRHELPKFSLMFALFFLIFFDYNVLRSMKDALVITAKSSGAEVIPFIKVWIDFPSAILLTYLFTRLSNRFRFEKVFYIMLGLFLTYFFLFAFVAFPLREELHLNETARFLETLLPAGFKGFVLMIRYWLFTSFYVMSDLWSPIVLSVLFWGFANQITPIQEAKRFYGLFGIGANISGAFAGAVSYLACLSEYRPWLPLGRDGWEQAFMIQILLVLVTALLALVLFRVMHVTMLNKSDLYAHAESNDGGKRPKLSMRDNFKLLLESPYLFMIASIVVAYNLVINLVEVVWKHEVKHLYPNPQDYNMYMGEVTFFTSIVATLFALFISGNCIRRFGWSFTAMLTPAILLATSFGFFGFLFLQEGLSAETFFWLGGPPLVIAVFFGTLQNILSRAAKYSVFDATKEMAFVPLSYELKTKGKSAIDGVGSRFGKSGGSIIHTSLLLTFSTISASAPYIALFLFFAIGIWISAVWSLGKKFNAITKESPEEDRVEPGRETIQSA